IGRLRLGELHLAEQRAHQQYWGRAADLFVDVFPAPSLLALDVENFLGEIGTCHGCLLGCERGIVIAHARCWARAGRGGAAASATTVPRNCPPSGVSRGPGRVEATCGVPGRTTGT